MCGIVGYIGDKDAVAVVMAGLHRLEYRGYDSAGVAVIENGELQWVADAGHWMHLEKPQLVNSRLIEFAQQF